MSWHAWAYWLTGCVFAGASFAAGDPETGVYKSHPVLSLLILAALWPFLVALNVGEAIWKAVK